MNFEPMQAAFIGGWEIILVLGVILCLLLVTAIVVGLVIYFFVIKRPQEKTPPGLSSPVAPQTVNPPPPAEPAPAASTPPPAPPAADPGKTEVMPRQCPQCHASLPADAPEGLCPACLLQRGFATESGAPGNPASQAGFEPPPMAELAKLFPQLEILACLGRGGMGAVYKARQPRLDRFVALKILAPEKQQDPQFAERFEREARALARLSHPNIVTVFDFGEVAGRFYLLMEFVDGLTLRQVLQGGKLASAEALDIVPKICEALQYAHEHGIVHRDIKPENILLDKLGRVKIADFGIAKIAGLEPRDFSLTGAKDVMGTPHYMAPEQIEQPQAVDHRADIYSLGVVFYEMLTGELPLGKFAPPSQKVNVDVRLDEVVLHALEKEPARRYQHASQVKSDVETVSTGQFTSGHPAPIPALPSARLNSGSDKTILPAFLLAFFFGVFGAHRFYVGKIWTAALQLAALGGCLFLIIVCATFRHTGQPVTGILLGFSILGCLIWATIDWLLLVCKAFTDGQGKRMIHWIDPTGGTTNPASSSPASSHPNPVSATGSPLGQGANLITAPAIALMVVGLWKLLSSLSGILTLAGVGGWLASLGGLNSWLGPWGSTAIFSIVLFKLIPGLLILFGAYQMLQRRSYAWSVAAGILAIISCSLIGLPIGIWALIILARDDVRTAFSSSPTATPPRAGSGVGRGLMLIIGSIILIPLSFVLLFALTSMTMSARANSASQTDKTTPDTLAQAGIYRDAAGEFRKDFTQFIPLHADGRFSLDNVKGKIEIHGWSSNAVLVTAVIHDSTAENVLATQIKIDSALDQARVQTVQPSKATGGFWSWMRLKNHKHNDAYVDYVIQVPQHAELAEVSSVNGRLLIDGISGNITASTVNVEMHLREISGNLKLNTVNGPLTADLTTLDQGQTVSLDTVNGRINLAVPETANATFSISTVNGNITSEFPTLQPKKEFPVGKNLNGSLGQGNASVKINSVNGPVKIVKRPPNLPAAPAPIPAVAAKN